MGNCQEIEHLFILYIAVGLLSIGMIGGNFRGASYSYGGCHNFMCGQGENNGYRGLAYFGYVCAVLAAIAMTCHYLMRGNPNDITRALPKCTLGLAVVGAVLIMLAILIFGYYHLNSNNYPGFQFVLTLVGIIFLVYGGIDSSRRH